MQTTIIYAHPYTGSLNYAVFSRVTDILVKNGKKVNVIDLYQDSFNPMYSNEELKLFHVGKTADPLVKKYQEDISNSDEIIFIFPIWWNDVPAAIKGFVDKVFKMNFAYVDNKRGVKGLLTNISKVVILTTSKSPNWYLRIFAGNAIKKVFINSTLKQVGINNVKKRSKDECDRYIRNLTI